MKLLDKIKSKTSKGNRLKGQASTLIGITCATVLSLGLVTLASPVLFVAATVGALYFGNDARKRMVKTEEEK